MKEMNGRLWLAVLAICLIVSATQAAPITIVNAGFEDPALDEGGYTGYIPGWGIASGSAGIIRVATGADPDFPLGGYSGQNVAYSGPTPDNASTFYQWLGITTQANTRYTLSVDVGDRSISVWNTALPETVRVELHTASGVLTPITALSSTPTPADGQMVTWTMVFDMPTEWAGGDLAVLLGSTQSVVLPTPGVQVQFDNVTLDASVIPEPTTLGLLATGVVVMLRRRRA